MGVREARGRDVSEVEVRLCKNHEYQVKDLGVCPATPVDTLEPKSGQFPYRLQDYCGCDGEKQVVLSQPARPPFHLQGARSQPSVLPVPSLTFQVG